MGCPARRELSLPAVGVVGLFPTQRPATGLQLAEASVALAAYGSRSSIQSGYRSGYQPAIHSRLVRAFWAAPRNPDS